MSIYDKENVREYKPVFNDDRDYTTNAPTYYDYMADVNNSVQKALEDIEGIVEGDIVDYVESDNRQLLEVTKKRVNGKHVGYTLTPLDPENTLTSNDAGIGITKVDNHTFEITTTRDVVKQYLVDGTGVYITWVGDKGSLNIDFTKVQAKLTFTDGVKLSGTTVSADWNKVQKVLTPDNKSIIIDENGRVSAQVPYDRLESKVDKWRTVGNVAGSIFEVGGDVQQTTVNPAFLKKSGTYFYLNRSKSDGAVWGGKPDTPTSGAGIIRVTSSKYNDFCLQEFYSMDGKNYFFRIGSNENMLGDTIHHSFWSPWRAVHNVRMYGNNKFGEGKGTLWGEGAQDSDLNYNAGSGTQRRIGDILAGDLSTIFTTTEKYSQGQRGMTDVIRFAYEGATIAGDCHTGSTVYYRVTSVNTVTQECHIVAHNAYNGTPIIDFTIEHQFFSNPIQDITVGNDRIYFINTWSIFWFSLNDYSTGYIEFPRTPLNTNADGTASTYEKHLRYKGISYYNDKLYVLIQEDYKAIANDNNLDRDVLKFAVWEITLNTNGTGRVSDKCLFSNVLTGVDMHYLQVINNNIYVGFNLDRLYNDSARSAYGEATNTNKYDPCGIGTLTFSMTGLMHEQCENVKDGLQITGLGHLYEAYHRQGENANVYNADGCIIGYTDMLLVSGYKNLVYTGVYSIPPYVNKVLPTVSFDKASKISYNSDGEAVVTSQVKDEETGKFVNVQIKPQAVNVEERTANPIV